jgi:hypothetical protein
VQVRASGKLGRLVVAAVHDGDVVAPGHQRSRDTAADEPGTAQDENPHAVTVRAGHGGQEGASANSRGTPARLVVAEGWASGADPDLDVGFVVLRLYRGRGRLLQRLPR